MKKTSELNVNGTIVRVIRDVDLAFTKISINQME